MKELARYLLQNAYIDFQGGIALDEVREYLRKEDSRESRLLLAKLIDEGGVDELMLTVADCLREFIPTGIQEETIQEQLRIYSES